MGADPLFVRYLRGTPWSVADAAAVVATNREIQAAIGLTMWALEDLRDGALVGYCGFGSTNAACLRPDLIEIGWALARDRWGQGLATEAAAAVLPLGIARFGRERIVSKCHLDNVASERVMHRIGLRRVGVVRALASAATTICRLAG
jgi:RimJ/RimL family protein N-acetyltransferase